MLKKVTMAPFSPKSSTCSYNARSISFPSRSHPKLRRIEEEINKLNAMEASSSSSKAELIRKRLAGLGEIHGCIGDLLNLPLTKQALSQHLDEKCINIMLDDLVKFLDVCSNTRDAALQFKEGVRDLESALRRSKRGNGGELSIESCLGAYISSRKKMKKEAAKLLASLKQMDCKCGLVVFPSPVSDADHYICAAVRALREASLITNSIFSSLLLFLSAPVLKPKPRRWSLISKLMHKGAVGGEGQQKENTINELESVDAAITNLLVQTSGSKELEQEKIQSAQRRLEALDTGIEDLENELESLFRHLINTRVSLLNIVSCKSQFYQV